MLYSHRMELEQGGRGGSRPGVFSEISSFGELCSAFLELAVSA